MSYTPTEWDIGDVITAEKMNKLERAVAGGGGYDLVLTVPGESTLFNASHVEVVSGDILECEQKIADGEPVNAILYVTYEWSFVPSGSNSSKVGLIARLSHWCCGYTYMSFTAVEGYGTGSPNVRVNVYNVGYDPDDGSIASINNAYMAN